MSTDIPLLCSDNNLLNCEENTRLPPVAAAGGVPPASTKKVDMSPQPHAICSNHKEALLLINEARRYLLTPHKDMLPLTPVLLQQLADISAITVFNPNMLQVEETKNECFLPYDWLLPCSQIINDNYEIPLLMLMTKYSFKLDDCIKNRCERKKLGFICLKNQQTYISLFCLFNVLEMHILHCLLYCNMLPNDEASHYEKDEQQEESVDNDDDGDDDGDDDDDNDDCYTESNTLSCAKYTADDDGSLPPLIEVQNIIKPKRSLVSSLKDLECCIPSSFRVQFDPVTITTPYSIYLGYGRCGSLYLLLTPNRHFIVKYVTISNLDLQHTTDQGTQTQCIIQELRKIASMNHPNVVSMAQCFFPDSSGIDTLVGMHIGYVIDVSSMGSLGALISKWKEGSISITWVMVLNWLKQILEGLRYFHDECHENHKDVKPDNILAYNDPISGDIVMKLADLGLSHVSQPHFGMSSLPFMAIEIVYRKPFQSASDIFSFALTAGILLSGGKEPPEFRGRSKERQQLKMHNWMYNPPSPFVNEVGFIQIIEILFTCFDDDYSCRATAKELLNVVESVVKFS